MRPWFSAGWWIRRASGRLRQSPSRATRRSAPPIFRSRPTGSGPGTDRGRGIQWANGKKSAKFHLSTWGCTGTGTRPWRALPGPALVRGRAGEFAGHAAGWQRQRTGASAFAGDSVRFESTQSAGRPIPECSLTAAGQRCRLRARLVVWRRPAERIEISSCGGSPALACRIG